MLVLMPNVRAAPARRVAALSPPTLLPPRCLPPQADNNMGELPASLFKLTGLEVLDLSGNFFLELSAPLAQLHAFTRLRCARRSAWPAFRLLVSCDRKRGRARRPTEIKHVCVCPQVARHAGGARGGRVQQVLERGQV